MQVIIGGFFMAIYTLAELETEISTYKEALSALAGGRTTKVGDKELTTHDIESVRSHLQWLDQQRDALLTTPNTRPAFGRTYAQNGRCR